MTLIPLNGAFPDPAPYLATPAFLTKLGLSDEERQTYAECRKQLLGVQKVNIERMKLYEGSNKVRHLDIAVPPGPLQDLTVVAGWGGSAIDMLNEKLGWDEWVSADGDLMGLDEVFEDNQLEDVIDKATTDALVCGTGFVIVGSGDPDNLEPEVLVTAASPTDCTILWDYRARRPKAALDRTVDDRGRVIAETLYLPGETITLVRDGQSGLKIEGRDEHGMPRIPVTRMPNRGRTSRPWGRSELTPAVRYLNDAAVRTMLGMEINREFYTTPQRWLMGADMSMFEDDDGNPVSTWQSVIGKMLAAPRPRVINPDTEEEEWGDLPTVGQFTPSPPTPYIDQVRFYSQEFGREIGVPSNYLGFHTENPASADAIRAAAERLISRTRRRTRGLTPPWREVAANIIMVRDGASALDKVRDKLRAITPNWMDPSNTTPTAATDEAVKLSSGPEPIIPPDSRVLLERIGLDKTQIARVEEDRRRRRGAARLALASGQAGQQPGQQQGQQQGAPPVAPGQPTPPAPTRAPAPAPAPA
jgi:hypothetical protein